MGNDIYITPDLQQDFNFKTDVQKPVGFMKSLTFGGKDTVTPDLGVAFVDGSKATVAAVMTGFLWSGARYDAIQMQGHISVANKGLVGSWAHSQGGKVDVSNLSIIISKYDPAANVFYTAVEFSGAGALVQISDGNVQLGVEEEEDQVVKQPRNHGFHLSVVPGEKGVDIAVGYSQSKKVVLRWGP